ncbi:hypothetical protein [Kitasatospora sp. NPDC059327]|uniref:hypothetical protein n=1 Tax=Kitasatospora sp. NPDC059327 TaxID=3346803 RepID=UPI003677D7A2
MFSLSSEPLSTSPSKSASVTSVLRAAAAVLLLSAPLLAAQPAAAEGPKTPQEAAACRSVLGMLVGGSLFGPGGVGAVCAVRPDAAPVDGTS